MKIRVLPGVLLAAVTMSGCASFVELKPAAQSVQVGSADAVASCTLRGSVHVKVLDKLGPIARDEGKLIIELNTLARNAAVDLQGDTVLANGPITAGERDYKVYRCR
ncbi:DUF4156 domain-containing protein [Chitinimonas naiadis]